MPINTHIDINTHIHSLTILHTCMRIYRCGLDMIICSMKEKTEAQKSKDLMQLSMRKRFQPKVSGLGVLHH